jgi:hypothetical protein
MKLGDQRYQALLGDDKETANEPLRYYRWSTHRLFGHDVTIAELGRTVAPDRTGFTGRIVYDRDKPDGTPHQTDGCGEPLAHFRLDSAIPRWSMGCLAPYANSSQPAPEHHDHNPIQVHPSSWPAATRGTIAAVSCQF